MQNSSSKLAYSYSNIEDILQCPLCVDRFRDPRALPCQHVFCSTCLKIITSSNKICSMITCPLCSLIFPYNNNPDQFPVSYIHKELLDLIPINCLIKGKCSKCKRIHSLDLCSCCCYYLCKNCLKNDRENILISLKHILQACSNIQTMSSFSINDLLHQANVILTNPQIVEFQDILSIYYQLNSIHNQMNTLPTTTKTNRTCENDDNDDNISKQKQIRLESTTYLNEQEQIDNDDDIVYIETIQSTSTLNG